MAQSIISTPFPMKLSPTFHLSVALFLFALQAIYLRGAESAPLSSFHENEWSRFEDPVLPRCGLACVVDSNCTIVEDSLCHHCIGGQCGQQKGGDCFYDLQCVAEDSTCFNQTCTSHRRCGQICETRANCLSEGSKCTECVQGVCVLASNNAFFDLTLVSSFSFICLLLLAGQCLRIVIPPLQWLHLPASVVGGIVGFILVQLLSLSEDLGEFTNSELLMGWSEIPSFMINIVFVSLFLGHDVPLPDVVRMVNKLRRVDHQDYSISSDDNVQEPAVQPAKSQYSEFRGGIAPLQQLQYGFILASSQYVVAMFLSLTLLRLIFGKENIHDFFGATLALGLEGGAGTCAGLMGTMTKMGWSEGGDVCLAFSTIGIISAVTLGITIVQIGRCAGILHASKGEQTNKERATTKSGFYKRDQQPSAGAQTISSEALDVLSLHICLIGIALVGAYLVKRFFIFLEQQSEFLTKYAFFSGFPLFPLAMVFGLIIQVILQLFHKQHLISASLMDRISGISLDFLIVAAMATISLSSLSANVGPIFVLSFFGLLNHMFVYFVMAPLILPNTWFERGLAEFGQSTGVTSTALLLLKLADPENKTPTLKAFSYKQLVHELILGGGLWTALVIPLIAVLGPWLVLLIAVVFLFVVILSTVFVVPYNVKNMILDRQSRKRGSPQENIEIGDSLFDDGPSSALDNIIHGKAAENASLPLSPKAGLLQGYGSSS
mmetsp:Transcript_5957/g.22608  ORF Transcript_5957/g.22608 Transcript_5957/m.22608 type:complete len:719 (-) Transcript_5957:60-2216(-)